jgi:hypothetical protein
MAAASCGGPVIGHRPAFVDPLLGDAPAEALASWQEATGGRYPSFRIAFRVAPVSEGAAAVIYESDHVAVDFNIFVSPNLPVGMHRRALLHELGHAPWLVLDPESGDPIHWHGEAPSVMRPSIDECADEIGAPELAAFERQYGRR